MHRATHALFGSEQVRCQGPHRRRALLTLFPILLGIGFWSFPFQPAYAAGTTTFIQFNMCGAAANTGCGPAGSNYSADEIANEVNSRQPSWFSLNEACVGQYNRVVSRVGSGYYGRFVTTRYGVSGCGGGDFGNAVIYKTSLATGGGYVSSYSAQDGSPETRRLLCRFLNYPAEYYVCVTHLTTNSSVRQAQAQQLAEKMDLNPDPPIDSLVEPILRSRAVGRWCAVHA